MTSLAYFHDCHSCYDERSIVQKKTKKPRLKEGILRDVFIQKGVVAWDNAPSNTIMVSLLLPGPMEMDQWLKDVRASTKHVASAEDCTCDDKSVGYGGLYAERAQEITSAPHEGEN